MKAEGDLQVKEITEQEHSHSLNDSTTDRSKQTGAARSSEIVRSASIADDQTKASGEKSPEERIEKVQAQLASQRMESTEWLSMTMGLGMMLLFGLGIAAIWSESVRTLWKSYWYALILGPYVGALVGYGIKKIIALAREGEDSKRARIIVVVIPLLAAGMTALIRFGANRMVAALEIVLILIAALIPAAAYFLFLTSRRPSLLNEFVGNLYRLGLLARRSGRLHADYTVSGGAGPEPFEAQRARVESYFQRFEAIYGSLRFTSVTDDPIHRTQFVEKLITAVDPGSKQSRVPQADVHLTDLFRANLVIPIGLVTALATLGWLLALQPELPSFWDNAATAVANTTNGNGRFAQIDLLPTPVNFAFLGAYFFGIQHLFRRFVRRDLGPNAYFAFANRVILAIVAAWIIVEASKLWITPSGATATADPSAQLLVLAFLIGVFPRLLWQVLSTAATRLAGRFVVPSMVAKQPLSELDGLTVWHESRLEEEDIENIPNMASADVVDLMLHTQIPAERLIGWIDQAILYSALGPVGASDNPASPRQKLRTLGIRTASQVYAAQRGGPADVKASPLEEALGPHASVLLNALELEPNFDLMRAWRQI